MFGDVLVSNDGIEVKTVDALAGKTVGVYFSAHWCPPCRQFTPMLAGVYDTLKREGREFEVVFASSDRTDADFAEYHKSMPWLAVPFANRDAKAKLSSKFKVQGIPTLVILDENGALVTKDGRRAVAQPEKFPWTPPTLTEALGETFVDKSGGETTLASIVAAGKNVGLYFSAHWCGPCRQFTPKLKELYAELVRGNRSKSSSSLLIVLRLSSTSITARCPGSRCRTRTSSVDRRSRSFSRWRVSPPSR